MTPFGLQHGRAEPEAAEHPCVLSIMEGLQFLWGNPGKCCPLACSLGHSHAYLSPVAKLKHCLLLFLPQLWLCCLWPLQAVGLEDTRNWLVQLSPFPQSHAVPWLSFLTMSLLASIEFSQLSSFPTFDNDFIDGSLPQLLSYKLAHHWSCSKSTLGALQYYILATPWPDPQVPSSSLLDLWFPQIDANAEM